MDDKNTLDRLKASYITLAEDYRMVQKKLPKAISVNNSTGLTYTLLSFVCSLLVILGSIISITSASVLEGNELLSTYIETFEELGLPFDLGSLGFTFCAIAVVILVTVLVSVVMRLRPSAKAKKEEKIEAPDDEERLFKVIHYICAAIPEECAKAKKPGLYMTLAPFLGALAAYALSLVIAGMPQIGFIVDSAIVTGALIVIFLVAGLILKAILFVKIRTIDIATVENRIREYEKTLTDTRNGIAAIEQAMEDMKAGNADEAIRKIRYSASLKNKDGEAASIAVVAMSENDITRMEINYTRLISVISEGIQNKDVEAFCISTADTLKEKVEQSKKERHAKAIEKYNHALQIVDEKADYNTAIALCEDACYENISGALLLDLYCRLARGVTRLEESFINQSFNTLCKATDLSEKEQAIFASIKSVIDPFLSRNFSITGNKNISQTVKTNVRNLVTAHNIETATASGKAAIEAGDYDRALKFFNIAASYKSVEAMSAYLATSLIRDIRSGKKLTDEEIASRKETMEKTLRLNFSDKALEAICRAAYDCLISYAEKAKADSNIPVEKATVAEDSGEERKQYMENLATALNKRAEEKKSAPANEKSASELFDFLMDD